MNSLNRKTRLVSSIIIALIVVFSANAVAQSYQYKINTANRLIVYNAEMILSFAHVTVDYLQIKPEFRKDYQGNRFGLTYTFIYAEENDPTDRGYVTIEFVFDRNGKLDYLREINRSSFWPTFVGADAVIELLLAAFAEFNPELAANPDFQKLRNNRLSSKEILVGLLKLKEN